MEMVDMHVVSNDKKNVFTRFYMNFYRISRDEL